MGEMIAVITPILSLILGVTLVAVLFIDIIAWLVLFVLMAVGGIEIPPENENSPLRNFTPWVVRLLAISAALGSMLIRLPLLNHIITYFFR